MRMIMILTIHTGYVNTAYSLLSFGTVYQLLWWRSSFTKYSHTKLWRFLLDNSFTKLILLDNVSQSILTSSVLLFCPPLRPSLDPSFCSPFLSFGKQISSLPFSWQSTFPCSLSVTVCLSVSVCISFSLSLPLSLPAISFFSAPVSDVTSLILPLSLLPVCWPSRFLPFVRCCMPSHGPLESFPRPSLYLLHVCNYT